MYCQLSVLNEREMFNSGKVRTPGVVMEYAVEYAIMFSHLLQVNAIKLVHGQSSVSSSGGMMKHVDWVCK